jgi:hypothetical protein
MLLRYIGSGALIDLVIYAFPRLGAARRARNEGRGC